MTVQTIALFGNRYSTMSESICQGLLTAIGRRDLPPRLVLIDTSTKRQRDVRTRWRNRTVSLAKRVLGAPPTTTSVDWYHKDFVHGLTRLESHGDLADARLIQAIRRAGIGAAIVAGCDQILKSRLIAAIPRIVNFHNSLLPAYRGCNAVGWALLHREPMVGYTFHTIDNAKIDAGRIVFQRVLPVVDDDTVASVSRRIVEDAAAHLPAVLELLLADEWAAPPPTAAKGEYYSGSRWREVCEWAPAANVDTMLRRIRVIGGVAIPAGRVRLVATAAQPSSVNPSRLPGDVGLVGCRVLARCSDGLIEVTAINHLPARAFAWALWRQ